MKKIILLSTLIMGALVFAGVTYAVNSTILFSPASADRSVGTNFNVAVQVEPQGNKVCVVKGTLNFNNLSCRNITLSSEITAQTMPTCANPNFSLGIQKCTTTTKSLMNISVIGSNVGQSSTLVSGTKIIGVGVILPSDSQRGNYNIVAVSEPLSNDNKETIQTEGQINNTNVDNQIEEQTSGLTASVGSASFMSVASKYFWPLLIILIVLAVGYVIYLIIAKRRKKEE